MRILYYDCFAGISGDMNLGAMIDLGVDAGYLKNELSKLNIEGFHLEVKTDQRRGITGIKADVVIENPDNEKHRHLRHVEEIVNNSSLSDAVKTNALKIFRLIAEAEAKVHNIEIQKVHFHEVGALDSIADIVGAAICLDWLKVDKVMASPIQLGGGTVKCAHGIMPVPAPATALIVEGLPVKAGLVNHEATTPTGAAILAAMVDEFSTQIDLPIAKTAYGIGNRDAEVANVLRVYLLDDHSAETDVETVEAVLLESNIDDMNPEHYDFILNQLFETGASDAWLTPIIMKKSRPAVMLSVLCGPKTVEQVKTIVFTHSTSLGIRERRIKKHMLHRQEIEVEINLGKVRVKQSYYQGRLLKSKPEADDCKRLALENGITLREVERMVINQLEG
ncbi:nickel pincer cofactor biosynthesis protein LarC [Mangrovibacterium sp.]|uniref:nickel pincer cofactor biosynthesis protein LarC n=1 Tax=Mangrovibacterium sp. TaxID=1961364 RepID=UPI003568B1D2